MRSWLAAMMVLAAVTGPVTAQLPPAGGAPGLSPLQPPSVAPPSSVTTSRGLGLVTGNPGAPQTILLPGSAIPGTLLNNGNGTSTIMVPGGPPEVVPTPR